MTQLTLVQTSELDRSALKHTAKPRPAVKKMDFDKSGLSSWFT